MTIRDLATVRGVRGPTTRNISGVPVILICFDDSGDSVHDEAFAYMRAYGLKLSFFFIGNQVAAKTSRLTPMYNYGNDIANHTQAGANLSGLNQAQVETELTDCQTSLESNGYTRASKHVAYPGGFYDATVLAAMASVSMLTGRTTLRGWDHYIPLADIYEINCDISFGNTTTLQQGKDWVDSVISKNKIGLGLFHHLVAVPALSTQWAISDFHDLIDYIISKQVPLMTIDQLYRLNSGESITVNGYRSP